MPCLICKNENLYSSTILLIEERKGVLEDIMCFVLCKDCGNVMMKTTSGELLSTEHIRDKEVIKLAYSKLFKSSAFSGTPPTQYGYTRDGAKKSTSEFKNPAKKPVDKYDIAPTPEGFEYYPHVDNVESNIGFFGKVARFVKGLFRKAS